MCKPECACSSFAASWLIILHGKHVISTHTYAHSIYSEGSFSFTIEFMIYFFCVNFINKNHNISFPFNRNITIFTYMALFVRCIFSSFQLLPSKNSLHFSRFFLLSHSLTDTIPILKYIYLELWVLQYFSFINFQCKEYKIKYFKTLYHPSADEKHHLFEMKT